jgi:excisionase family DNA binding protein
MLDSKYITVTDAAAQLGYSRTGLLKIIHAGKIKTFRRCDCGQGYLVLASEINRLPKNARKK